jgi:hypothetical protein
VVPDGLLERVLAAPDLRPGVVDRARARLAARQLVPTAAVMATGVVERLLAERRT